MCYYDLFTLLRNITPNRLFCYDVKYNIFLSATTLFSNQFDAGIVVHRIYIVVNILRSHANGKKNHHMERLRTQ
jgi:hypothetical protein